MEPLLSLLRSADAVSQLSAVATVDKFIEIVKPLPTYTPALGHRYFHPSLLQQGSATNPTSASSAQSRIGTPLPAPRAASPEVSTDAVADGPKASQDSANIAGPQALFESFGQYLSYGNEYMDENPLVGEPGSFVFSTSRQSVQARKDAALKAQQATTASNKVKEQEASRVATPQAPSAIATPQPKPADLPGKRKGSQGPEGRPKIKRRKSKAPTNPSSPLSVGTPETPIG